MENNLEIATTSSDYLLPFKKRHREFVTAVENKIMSSNKRVCIGRTDHVQLLNQRPEVLEEDAVQEEGVERRVQRRRREVVKRKASPKKKVSPKKKALLSSLPRTMPNYLKIYVQTRGIDLSEVKLVIVKRVTKTDTADHQDRLSIPYKQVIDHDFITPEEKMQIRMYDGRGRQYDGGSTSARSYERNPLHIELIEPCLETKPLKLQVWDLNTSSNYVLMGGWKDVVNKEANRIQENNILQVWSFRIDGKLYFAASVVNDDSSNQ